MYGAIIDYWHLLNLQCLSCQCNNQTASSLGTFGCRKIAVIVSPSATAANRHRFHLLSAKTSAASAVAVWVYKSYVQLLFDACFCKWYKDDELLLQLSTNNVFS